MFKWPMSLGLLRDEPRRQRRPLAEEKIFHVFLDEFLRLFLPRHQSVLVENHLHPFFPQFPGFYGNVFVDPLSELARPGGRIQTEHFFLELLTEDLPAGHVRWRRGRLWGAARSHFVILTA